MILATLSPAGLQFWHSIVLITIVGLFTLAGAAISVLRVRQAARAAKAKAYSGFNRTR